jgi:hypothetical protein
MTPYGNAALVNDGRHAIHDRMTRRRTDFAGHENNWRHQQGEQNPEGNSSFHGNMLPHPKGEIQ